MTSKENPVKQRKQVKSSSDGPRSTTQRLIGNRAGAKPEARADLPILQHGPACNFFEFERCMITHLRREYGDLCMIITDDMMPELPELESADELGLDREEYKFYKNKYYEQRVKLIFDQNFNSQKIAGLIFGQLSRISEEKVREHKEWPELYKRMRGLDLWRIIKETHSTAITGVTETDKQAARSRFSSCRQYPKDESISDFKRRFDDAVALLKATGGTQPDEQELATQFTYKLDRGKYAKYIEQLENLVTLKAVDFPKTLAEAYNNASKFVVAKEREGKVRSSESVFNTNTTEKESKPKQPKKDKSVGKQPNESKHKAKKQKNDHQHSKACLTEDTTNGKTLICYLCGELGHFVNRCPLLSRAAELLKSTNDSVNYSQFDEEDNDSQGESAFVVVSESVLTKRTLESSTDTIFKAKSDSKRLKETDVLLDNQATAGIFHNKELLSNFRETERRATISGVGGDSLSTNTVADFEGFGEVFYHPKAAANILSFSKIEAKHKIEYLPRKGFIVKLNPKTSVIFTRRTKGEPGEGLYVADMKGHKVYNTLATVKDNASQFTKAEQSDAKRALLFEERMGFPSKADAIAIANNGVMTNIPITSSDIRRAAAIYGPNPAALKGKTTEKKPRSAKLEFVLKPEVRTITLHIDTLFVAGKPILLSVSSPLHLTVVNKLASRSATELKKVLFDQFRRYEAEGFQIYAVRSDGESGVKAIKGDLEAYGVMVDTAGTGQHVPIADRMIRTVKERARSILASLPYTLPDSLKHWVIFFAVNRINMQPTTSRGDQICPREAFTGRKIDYKRDVRVSFGEYVHVNVAGLGYNKNDISVQRTHEAIALLPVGNMQGSVIFLSLETKKTIVRDHWTSLPFTKSVIEKLNGWAAQERSKPGQVKFADEELEQAEPVEEDKKEDAVILNELAPRLHPAERPDIVQDLYDLSNDNEGSDSIEESSPVDQESTDVIAEDASENVEEIEEVQSAPVPVVRRSSRQPKSKVDRTFEYYLTTLAYVFQMTVKEGLEKHGEVAKDSIKKELKQMIDKKVWKPIKLSKIPKGKRIIYSSMFLKEKYDSRGIFEKLKARLAAGGDVQDKSLYDNISSPTVQTNSVFIELSLAGWRNSIIVVVDITGAYLNADMIEDVFMSIDRILAEILIDIDPSYREYLNSNGKIVVKLEKALYGCLESALLWFNHIKGTLVELRFKANQYDQCVFHKNYLGGDIITICVYVDDLLITSVNQAAIDEVINGLNNKYKDISVKTGKTLSYLGMTISTADKGKVRVSMEGYINDMLKLYEVPAKARATSPATASLFQRDELSPALDKTKLEEFRSRVAKLLYLAKRVRPDILLTCVTLASRVTDARQEDWHELDRCIRYINHTKDLYISLEIIGRPIIHAYVDASFAVHMDGKSHTGVCISLGKGCVYANSSKQKLVTRSSTEAELVALSDSASQGIWTKLYLEDQGIVIEPVIIYQDNESTIKLITNGRANNSRMRHVNIRYFFVKDRIEQKDVKVKSTRSEDMKADNLTKPTQGSVLSKHRHGILVG